MRALALAALIALATPAGAVCFRDHGPRTIEIEAVMGANGNSATAIDIVFVSTPEAAALLPRTGTQWFANRAALQAGLGKAISVVSLQIPPASIDTLRRPKGVCRPLSVLVFANMLSAAGQPVLTLTGDGTLQIRETDLVWTPKQP
jgi:type VI secretion system protein